jgi:hypothetical protein
METNMHRCIIQPILAPTVALIILAACLQTTHAQYGCGDPACAQCGNCNGGCMQCGCCGGGCPLFAGHDCSPGYKPHMGCCLCEGGGVCCPACGVCEMGYMKPIKRAQWYNWNRNYAYTDYGAPTALVVPPTANLQTNWGWGVASSRISRIDHQFQRNYPGAGTFGGPFRPTPVWPHDTIQFGVYPVRGPW